MARSQLLPGISAWKSADHAPDFAPERSPGLHFAYRRWPAALRVLGIEHLTAIAPLTEPQIYAIVRYMAAKGYRSIAGAPFRDGSAPDHAETMRLWLLHYTNKPARSWWRSQYGWKSPREFPGYTKRMAEMGLPKMEPFEVAHFRLPDDISCDPDVVLFQAWCQGVMLRHLHDGSDLHRAHYTAVRRGLEKFARSPWVRFAVAAPHMQPVGLLFPPASYFETCARMEWLLKHPFEATDAEMHYIVASEMFRTAIIRAKKLRKGGDYMNPPGYWYPGGTISQGLGASLRRGGEWTADGQGKR